jgi:hypothetical protein
LFQDNFAADGTRTGTVRADIALDIMPGDVLTILPGDSAVVRVGNPEGSLATDIYSGVGPAVYTYVHVRPPGQPGKSGEALSGGSRWPVVDSLMMSGETWYCIRMDSAFVGGSEPDTAFCVDLNDNLFTPGDTIFYVFGAIADQPTVEATYYSRFTGTTDDIAYAMNNAMEFTCLPTQEIGGLYEPVASGAPVSPAPILYVDFHDGYGSQPDFDAAFDELGIAATVDRYDVLSPSSAEGNAPGGRVVDVIQQLTPAYRRIIWSTGDLGSGVLGEGSASYYESKADDAGMLKAFLDALEYPGGVYFTGDDLAEEWSGLAASGPVLRDAYMQFTLTNGDHAGAGYGVSPRVIAADTSLFFHNVPDSLVAFGGCPSVTDFDVLQPQGPAHTEMTYESGPGTAVLSQRTDNPNGVSARVVLSGFAFHEIQDVHDGGVPESPTSHLRDILNWLIGTGSTGVDDAPRFANTLAQNVPNPFNPSTTIEFTLRERAPVTLRIYNVRGQLVKTLVNGTRVPGIAHRIAWDGRNDAGRRVASGVYFYRLVAKGYTKTRKMVLLK